MKQYVGFNQETGDILRIGPSQEGTCIEVEYELATQIKTGERRADEFKVLLDDKTKKYVLQEIRKNDELTELVVDEPPATKTIYQLPMTQEIKNGINVIQDMDNGNWTITVTGDVKKLLEKMAVSNRGLKQLFYVTDKSNPNIIYDTLTVDLNQAIETGNMQLINFDKQTAQLNISVFCRNIYNDYYHVRTNGKI